MHCNMNTGPPTWTGNSLWSRGLLQFYLFAAYRNHCEILNLLQFRMIALSFLKCGSGSW